MMEDVLRFAVVALASVTGGAVLAVIRLHWRAWRKTPRPGGLVPAHVFLIATSHLIFVIGTAVAALNSPALTWWFWLYAAANLLTLVALYIIGDYQRRRLRGDES